MFSWKSSAWTVQKQPSTTIHFGKFIQKLPVMESFFWLNYRLAVQSSDYIPKWLHQECFLGNLPKDFGVPKYHRLLISEINSFLVAKVTSCGCRTFTYTKQIFSWITFLFSYFPGNFLVYNNRSTLTKEWLHCKAILRFPSFKANRLFRFILLFCKKRLIENSLSCICLIYNCIIS